VSARLLGPANLIPGRVEARAGLSVLVSGPLQLGAARAAVAPGGRGLAFFRPEAARLHTAPPPADARNVFAASVEGSGWHDHGWRHRLRAGPERTGLAVLSPHELAPGRDVWVEVPPEACRILPEERPA
jgi:hypothetical protein